VIGDAPAASEFTGRRPTAQKLDEYLSSIRDVGERIQNTERSNSRRRRRTRPPASIPTDFAEHSHLMLGSDDSGVSNDATRVITVLLGIEQNPRNYPRSASARRHHGLTHHQATKPKIEKVTQINEYHIKQFAWLLDKMKAIPDGDGSLLDHSMIIYGAALAEGNSHQHGNLPTCSPDATRQIQPGRHVRYPAETADHQSLSIDARPDERLRQLHRRTHGKTEGL